MVDVVGKFKLDAQGGESSGEVEELQNSACVDWVNKDFLARCKTFDRDGWLSLSQKLPTKPMHYCIDRFEYPNRAGENPMIVVTYNESAALCKASGKRLCTESEWTFACEGDGGRPLPVRLRARRRGVRLGRGSSGKRRRAGELRRLRPTRRGAVAGFPLPQLPRRLAARMAAGMPVLLVAQSGRMGECVMQRTLLHRWAAVAAR